MLGDAFFQHRGAIQKRDQSGGILFQIFPNQSGEDIEYLAACTGVHRFAPFFDLRDEGVLIDHGEEQHPVACSGFDGSLPLLKPLRARGDSIGNSEPILQQQAFEE